MASVGKKLALNFAKAGSRALKPNFPTKKAGHGKDDVDGDPQSGARRKVSHDSNLSANISVGTPLYNKGSPSGGASGGPAGASGGLGYGHDGPMDHEQIVQLTHYVRSLSEALGKLKAVFVGDDGEDIDPEDLRVSAHDKLGEVLGILKEILQKYPALHTTDVLTTAAMLITKVKSSHYEEVTQEAGGLLYMIDQLSLAFSTSVSDYLMGDIDNFPPLGKTKSYDNLASDATLDDSATSPDKSSHEGDDEIDGVLQRLAAHGGVDRALLQAKLWSKYVKEITTYVEKKNALENEYTKNLTKLATSLKNSMMKESFLPMQVIFCTAFDQDTDYSTASQMTCAIIQTQKFVEPLTARRVEHEKGRKQLKDTWAKELKRMQESVGNLQKARANYISRHQEHDKAREAAQRAADATETTAGTPAHVAKLEKKRKLEEDAVYKTLEAETTYKACVADANHRQKELEKVKCRVLAEVRDLIYHSDQIMKQVTVAYFQMLHTLSAPKPVQFQMLCEASHQYDPGSQYVEYVKRIHAPSDLLTQPEPFVFEPYSHEGKGHDQRKTDESPSKDPKPPTVRVQHPASASGGGGDGDTDSVSDGSSRSQESSPTASPNQRHRHTALSNSVSLGKMAETSNDARLGVVSEQARMTFRGVELSPAARTHLFKKLRTLSKCRECESYVYFQGAECERCGLTTHKKCLESLHWECGRQAMNRRMTTFGVDFSEHVQETHTEIPRLIWKCSQEVDQRGLDIRGIYRVSGVKSRVESLCQGFELDEGNVDLSDHNPNVIANVLKLYLRQLPEPLMSFKLYPEFIRLAKEDGGGQGPASPEMVQKLCTLVHKLSTAQFKTCGHLMYHLKRVTENQEINQMSAYNLGVVFGPTLLRQSEELVSLDSLLDTPCQTRIVEQLILNVESIFGSEDQFRGKDALDEASSPLVVREGPGYKLDTDTAATVPGTGGSETGSRSPGARAIPEIIKELVTTTIKNEPKQPAPPSSPTLLEMANKKLSPRSDSAPPSPAPVSPIHISPVPLSPLQLSPVPASPTTVTDSFVAVRPATPEDFLQSDSDPPTPAVLHYKSLTPPQQHRQHRPVHQTHSCGAILDLGPSPRSNDVLDLGQSQRNNDLLDLSASSGSTDSPLGSRKKKILPSQVRSRDASPDLLHKMPALSKPQPYTPPTHRRLCRTGTGGLLERPVTPDPLPEDEIVSYRRYRYERGLSKAQSFPNVIDACTDDSDMSTVSLPTTTSQSQFYRAMPTSPLMDFNVTTSTPNNNNNNKDGQSTDSYPVRGTKSVFYKPLPRMGRRHSHEPLLGSPIAGRHTALVPKDESRQPKYV